MMQVFVHDPAQDRHSAAEAQKGDLEARMRSSADTKAWIFHIAQRMLWNRADAEDATQEILTKAITTVLRRAENVLLT